MFTNKTRNTDLFFAVVFAVMFGASIEGNRAWYVTVIYGLLVILFSVFVALGD